MKVLALAGGKLVEVDLPVGSGLPLTVTAGSSYTVSSGTQAIGGFDITVDGDLILDGELMML